MHGALQRYGGGNAHRLHRLIVLIVVGVLNGAHAAQIDSAELRGGAIIESHFCGCEDKPNAHYPYSLVIVRSAQGDVIARPEGQESAVQFVPIAIRRGVNYCKVESENECYGEFAHPCEFTDFRFGPTLAPYFPSCKAAAGN